MNEIVIDEVQKIKNWMDDILDIETDKEKIELLSLIKKSIDYIDWLI